MSAITPRVNLEKIKLTSSVLDEFTHNEFNDCHTVRIAFRTLGSRKHEHFLNKHCANLTRVPGEKRPAGALTHAEIILPVRPGVYVKGSVIKKRWSHKDESGNDVYVKMGSFLKRTDPAEWARKYVFLTIHASRDSIFKCMKFLVTQNDGQFNDAGYYANLLLPGGIGTRQFRNELLTYRTKWFCTELLVCALQCLSMYDKPSQRIEDDEDHWRQKIWTQNAAKSSPNSLYRVLKASKGVVDDIPIGSQLQIL
jgi:hypothetical protein